MNDFEELLLAESKDVSLAQWTWILALFILDVAVEYIERSLSYLKQNKSKSLYL